MTGLLYLMVIVMWAVVLVPIWLKSHERSRIEQTLREVGELPAKWHWAKRQPRDARTQAFIRRRRALMTLLSALIGSILMSASGVISPLLIVVPAGLLVAFLSAALKVTRAPKRVSPAARVQTAATPAPQAAIATEAVLPAAHADESRRWQPVESPVPSYVLAAKATAYPRNLDAQKPYTSQEMLEQATALREERSKRLKAAQLRLEEARAVSMEKARKAALGAVERKQTAMPQIAVDEPRAVNE
jgi:hypothetical protein